MNLLSQGFTLAIMQMKWKIAENIHFTIKEIQRGEKNY